MIVIDSSKQALLEDRFSIYLVDCLIQMVEHNQINDILVLAFYDTDIWLANCKLEVRLEKHESSEIRITRLIANEDDPYNILMCDEVYFNTITERGLTLNLLRTTRQYLEEKTSQYLN